MAIFVRAGLPAPRLTSADPGSRAMRRLPALLGACRFYGNGAMTHACVNYACVRNLRKNYWLLSMDRHAIANRLLAAANCCRSWRSVNDGTRLIAVIPISNANVGSRRYPPLSGGKGGWQLLQKPVFRAQRCGSASRQAPPLPSNDRSRHLRTDALDPYPPIDALRSCLPTTSGP